MAQFDFLGTWQDSWAILASILSPGDVSLIADIYYDQPQVLSLATVEDTRAHCLNGVHKFYVSCKSFSVNPPIFRRIDSGKYEGKYVIENDNGGPFLVLLLPACYRYDGNGAALEAFEDGNPMHLASGILMYQRLYWNAQSQLWETPSADVKAGYKELLRRVKTQLIRHQFHQPIWIGKDAVKKVENGNATIHGFGLD